MRDEGKDPGGEEELRETSEGSDAPLQGELLKMSEMVQLERDRIKSHDRRTEISSQALNAAADSDERQYNYHMDKLRRDDEDRRDRRKSGMLLIWSISGISAVFLGFLLLMGFFGDPTQREAAKALLSTLGTGTGGFGIGWIMLMAFRRFMNR